MGGTRDSVDLALFGSQFLSSLGRIIHTQLVAADSRRGVERFTWPLAENVVVKHIIRLPCLDRVENIEQKEGKGWNAMTFCRQNQSYQSQ